MSAKYISLKTVVSYCLDANNKSIASFDRAWVLAFRGLVDLHRSIAAQPKTVRLPVEGNKTVILPADYVSWSKIGVLNNQGEVCSLRINNGLSTFRDNNPNRLTQIAADITGGVTTDGQPIYLNYYENGACYHVYGIGAGLITYGDCRVDEANNLVVLGPDFAYDSIIMEYLSNPQADGDYQVEVALQEALIAFIEWKLKLAPEQSYYDRVIEARRSMPHKKVTLQSLNQIVREGGGFYLKA